MENYLNTNPSSHSGSPFIQRNSLCKIRRRAVAAPEHRKAPRELKALSLHFPSCPIHPPPSGGITAAHYYRYLLLLLRLLLLAPFYFFHFLSSTTARVAAFSRRLEFDGSGMGSRWQQHMLEPNTAEPVYLKAARISGQKSTMPLSKSGRGL